MEDLLRKGRVVVVRPPPVSIVVLDQQHRGHWTFAGSEICGLLFHTIFINREVLLGQVGVKPSALLIDDRNIHVDDLRRELYGRFLFNVFWYRRNWLLRLLGSLLFVGLLFYLLLLWLAATLRRNARKRDCRRSQQNS